MPTLPKKVNHLVGKAMHLYEMISEGDNILVAVSGGVDSLALAWLLGHWRDKAPISYNLTAVHLDMGFDDTSAEKIESQLKLLALPYIIKKTKIGVEAEQNNKDNACFICSKKRRNMLFEMARTEGFSKIAFGHHKDDIIETFFLNIFYSGNISTMVPKQDLFSGDVALIRPLAYLEKKQVIDLANAAGLTPVKNPCPMASSSKRESTRTFLTSLFEDHPSFKGNIFAALANVRPEYLLKK